MSLERPQAQESLTLKPQHIEVLGGGKVEFIPQRGGMVTDLLLRGRKILYMDPATLLDPAKNVRGGIPILFPNAGSVTSSLYPNLPQHGVVRNSPHWEHDIAPDKKSFNEWFHSDKDTAVQYPYKFLLQITGALEADKFTIIQSVTNAESDKEMPVAMGLHPYFPVKIADKANIKFDFPGGEVLGNKKGEWMQGAAVSIDNPKRFGGSDMPIIIPNLGTLLLEASPEYKKIWVWSLPDQDFICIEPVMRDKGGLVDDPEFIAPAEIYSAKFSIKLDR